LGHADDDPRPLPVPPGAASGSDRPPGVDDLRERLLARLRKVLLAPLEERYRTLEAGLGAISTRVSGLESAKGSLTADLETLAFRTKEIEDRRNEDEPLWKALEGARARLDRSIDALAGDADRIRHHLATLQEDHTALKITVASLEELVRRQGEAVLRFELLWRDVNRDLEGFVKTLSRLDADPSSR
jgi:chromosome segregation ATPase